ncbi:hypothetical protein ABBQ32_001122 [Trebouxia sp. C0010 RCD-2024]
MACVLGLHCVLHYGLHGGLHDAEALVLALGRVSSLIVTLSETGRALQRADAAFLDQLVAGLRRHPDTHAHSDTLNTALLACMQPLEKMFKDADNVALSSLVSTVHIPAGPGPATQASQAKTAAVSMFDDDLDVGAPVVAASGANRPTSAGPASASLATSCRLSCLNLITSLGMLDPNSTIATLLQLIHHSGSSHPKPPPELVHRALRCLCDLVATAEGCHHIRQATAALIGEPNGLLAHHRFQRDEVLMVLQLLSQLAKTFLSQHGSSSTAGQWSEAVQQDLAAMMNVLEEVMRIIAAAESKGDKPTSWQIRVQLATSILDLILIDTEGFGDELLSACLEKVTKLLSDDMYFARRHGACLATVLYGKWTRPQSVFDDLQKELQLRSLASGDLAAEHMETGVLMLGETAAACGALEREAVFLLCGHAAQHPPHIGLVGAALDMLAARLHYPSRSSLMPVHAQTLVFDWCSHNLSLQHFLTIQELVAVDERGGREQRALITSYMHHLLPVLLLDQREEQLQEVATCLGTDVKVLLQKCLHSILGSALPYKETGDAEERTLANTVTAGGLLLKHLTGKLALLDLLFSQFAPPALLGLFALLRPVCSVTDIHWSRHKQQPPTSQTPCIEGVCLAHNGTASGSLKETTFLEGAIMQEERNKLFHSKAVSVISTVLLSASDEPTPARPFFPIKTVLAAINHAPNQKDAKMNQDVLWAKASYSNCPHAICCFLKVVFTTGSFGFRQHRVQVLRGDAIGTLLVSCHQQLQKTRHPRHARQALGPLKALLALLGDAVTVPSTFRYASTILLQQLNSRERWGDCCQLLQSILDRMLKQQSSLEVVGAHLQTMLASIMASLHSNLGPANSTRPAAQGSTSGTNLAGDAASEAALVKLVLRLTVQAPSGLHVYLRDVEPLLPLPALEPACRYLSSLLLDVACVSWTMLALQVRSGFWL